MLTQISIKPDGCKTEYTKIASHSFGFTGDFTLGNQNVDTLYFAGDYDPITGTDYPVWSATKYDFGEYYTAGNLALKDSEKTAGIALPINLVPNDKITLSGTAYYPYYADWIGAGFTSISLIVGVYYFNCSASGEKLQLFTFIPVTLTDFDEFGTACFNAEVTLGSSFDFHETRIVIGYNTYATGDAVTPSSPTILTVSHTLDIERPCQAAPSNFIIKNCCEGSITELVNIPGLVVGNFHVDDEGNCWEVMEQSNDVTNFTRTFVDNYATCLECQDANPCPLNLKINSCCVNGAEFVTGSLPGLVVGDTFVDNHGLCWTVSDETSAPISEESITVDTIIMGSCDTCTTANPCPNFYGVESCCARITGVIAVPTLLNEGDAFVDTNGICWRVTKIDVNELPTIYGIEVDTVYPYQGEDVEPTSCDLCIAANPCPTEYFITIKSCCDNDRVEVAQVPADFMSFTEGSIFKDIWGVCWEVISFNTTGVETYIIADWNTNPALSNFPDCKSCLKLKGTPCGLYEVKECGSETTTNVLLLSPLTSGLFYSLQVFNSGTPTTCYEIIGYASPVLGETYTIFAGSFPPATTCEECEFYSNNPKRVRWEYCNAPGVTYVADTTLSGHSDYGYLVSLQVPIGGPKLSGCIHLVSLTTDPVDSLIIGLISVYANCESCLINNPR
jgi:hypothetical protein